MPFPARSLCTTVLAAALLAALPARAVQPTPLEAQPARLAGLLGDSCATAYPEATQIQKLDGPHGQTLVPALVDTPSDAANFPSKPARIRLVLDRGGFAEAPAGSTP